MDTLKSELPCFSKNLKLLCSTQRSTAELCKKIGLNRQQFNKYLAGQHHPSPKNLRLITTFFGLKEEDLFLPAENFKNLIELQSVGATNQALANPRFARFIESVNFQLDGLSDYYGYYWRYHRSTIYDGMVVRSAAIIFKRDGIATHHYLERFPNLSNMSKIDYTFKYSGYTFMMDNHIVMIDFETSQKNEMTYTNLTPVNRNPVRFLFGITTGVAATRYREPYAEKVALEKVNQSISLKEHLKSATVLEADDDSIPLDVKNYLFKD